MAKTMSGSGGFYKYRCKYFYAKSCQNWVYVNGEACMTCLVSHAAVRGPRTWGWRVNGAQAEGCDTDLQRSCSPDVRVPRGLDGTYGYAMVGRDVFSAVPVLEAEDSGRD